MVSTLVVWAIFAAAPAHCVAVPPAIAFESEICDLGNVIQGEKPECVFSFNNAGGADLRILGVEPSCGCTMAELSVPLFRPGEHGSIRVVFDSDNFAGEIVKEIEVRSNTPARLSVTLRVQALVEAEIDFEPRGVTFDDVRAGTALKQAVMLTNRRAEPVRILRLAGEPSSYRCLMPAWTDSSRPLVLQSWDRVAIEVFFSHPETLAMAIAGECTLEVEGPRKRYFTVKLLALPAP